MRSSNTLGLHFDHAKSIIRHTHTIIRCYTRDPKKPSDWSVWGPVLSVSVIRVEQDEAAEQGTWPARLYHAKNKIAGRIMQCFSLKAQDPGSGQKILAKWHGSGAFHGVFPETWF